MLRTFADDGRVTVRAALAINPAAPCDLHDLLAEDADQRVRILLARKLAQFIPELQAPEREQFGERVLATLAGLVEDEAVRVRAVIADVVKEMPEAPRELILRLAHDSAMLVSEPVIRLSPLLNVRDLLALLANPPAAQTATAVARRPGLCEAVADAIAASADNAAIAALLSNQSAAIREATLDALVARAANHEDWHDPLVHRPKLTARAARALSEIVTTHLLEVLASRGDLESGVTAELRRRLAKRSEQAAPARPADATIDDAMAAAHAMDLKGELDERSVLAAAQRGDVLACTAMLAVAAGVPGSVVQRAATLRSAKGLVSLVWTAGFSMRAALGLQMLIARLAPNAVLRPTPSGEFPLAADEMRWQLDVLKRMAR
jgi:uncharacterized protein (DUF2336 family)